MKTIVRWMLAALICVGAGAYGHGQSAVDGAIGGTVMDVTNSAVPGATVVVHNNGTNAEQTTTADGQGFFNVVRP